MSSSYNYVILLNIWPIYIKKKNISFVNLRLGRLVEYKSSIFYPKFIMTNVQNRSRQKKKQSRHSLSNSLIIESSFPSYLLLYTSMHTGLEKGWRDGIGLWHYRNYYYCYTTTTTFLRITTSRKRINYVVVLRWDKMCL